MTKNIMKPAVVLTLIACLSYGEDIRESKDGYVTGVFEN